MDKEKREMLKRIGKLVDPYRVTRGKKFRLEDFDPGDTGGLGSDHKPMARELLGKGIQWLAEEQDKLYAQDRHSLLLVFQAMDAAGKDSTIRHVMSGVNPQGCQVFSFKQPSMEELSHDYLWLPEVPAARPHRHLQPVVLGGVVSACTRNCSGGRICRGS
jgi:polyphosphate kinase 2 (PPK2 family)